MKFLVTPRFARDIKGLHPAEKRELDKQLRALGDQPGAGDMKKGPRSRLAVAGMVATNLYSGSAMNRTDFFKHVSAR